MSIEEDLGFIKGTLDGLDRTFANIENHMHDQNKQNKLNAASFATHDTQIIDIKEDLKESKKEVKEVKGKVTKNKESIDKLKKNGKAKSIGRLAFWSAIIVAVIALVSTIITKVV